ncbi:tripartite tricarboxylate transporter TctB family protein [Nesterenkonia sandarakina]|uniref:Tripartite tricarboxylate transporter TctB family protein n=1 Tax=Nesterenkonia sandarakina TaxID=272918 RepID=A0A2T0YKK3_9MICC|nr:tripartite tricarboxylate transporter TctB family protein [Nesterenkonia sandarakina]PRZ15569.1 tripartite tricarboxylate transporter TctB family protein [Nesterenkonia sandarakina]
MILGLIFGLTAILLVRSFVAADQAVSFKGLDTFLKVHWRVPAMVAMLSVYVALLGLAGFVLSSMIFLLGGFALLIREYSKPVLIASLALATLLPFTLNWVFENVLRTVLP